MGFLDQFTGCGQCSLVSGVILLLLGAGSGVYSMMSADSAGDITFIVEGQTSGEWIIDQMHCDGSLGYEISAKEEEKSTLCDWYNSTKYNESDPFVEKGPDANIAGSFKLEPSFMMCSQNCENPPGDHLLEFGLGQVCQIHLFNDWPRVCNEYDSTLKFTSPVAIWAIDTEKEFGEAVGGILGAALYGTLALILGIIGLIMALSPCCCCKKPA